MKYNKIFIKLSSIIMIIFLIVLLPLGFIMNKIFTNVYIEKIEQETKQVSENYENMIHSLKSMNIIMIGPLSEMINKSVILVNSDGKIIVNTGVNGFSINTNDLNKLKTKKSINHILTIEAKHYFVSGRPLLSNQGHFIGSIFVISSLDDIYGILNRVKVLLLISSIGAFFIALGFTYIISRRLSLPLIEMERATRRIAKGDLDTRVQVLSHDEIGSLASAINDLAYEIQKYRKTRQEFFANVSHELKTPVTYLAGYSKVLKDKVYETDAERDQYLDIIENEAKRLNRLINDLFELSKMEEGRLSLKMEPVDIIEILENVLQKFQLSAIEKGLIIDYNFDQHISLINGDGERLEQIFINLINNSIRYTEEGMVTLNVNQNNHEVVVSVIDTGVGIPENELSQIFDRFYRIEKSRSRQYGGTGLGLSIVKTLTELQGGTIEVESIEGEGTTFRVRFPIIDGVSHYESV